MNEYSRNATYQLCQVPMLVQTINPVHLSLTLTHSLQQYSQIIDEMTNQRVFTENAIDVLSQMLKNAKCDLAKNYMSAINIMLTIGNNIYDCGNTYIGRLKEKKALLSQVVGTMPTLLVLSILYTAHWSICFHKQGTWTGVSMSFAKCFSNLLFLYHLKSNS